ncbi:methyl-accepting chemotaxis protein [Clostridium cellulovorans]|uniref:Methyl-accepting chemotaxis sensory transducer n=1 Tax=Clostridium cellulovorans (strain ATCC 35296 / DSM 3052 / OCM 3 / 743B) TaxID=573061 RepID=D9SR19_CLOC7|nr:methyl-accepting chemotaxis protein [Clostridium cellulovorans]ADL50307.1 methyl-accepting chemotaxis sensory transducer [Clostridium cellulovorans 743B]
MKISKKIMYSVIVVNVVLIIIGYFVSRTIIQNVLNSDIRISTEEKSDAFAELIEEKKITAVNNIKWLEGSSRLIKAVQQNNRGDIIELGKQAMSNFEMDYFVITDANGNVIARAHEPEKFGDSILKQANIEKALKGEVTVGIEEGTTVRLSIRAGCPIKNENGQIIGAVSMGYVLADGFVDEINEKVNCEVTIFNGIERVGTTIKDGEKRITGTKIEDAEIEDTVLNQGKSIDKVVTIDGKKYVAVYSPLFDVKDNIIGMKFVGVPADIVQSVERQLVIAQVLISFITIVVSLLVLLFILQKSVTSPLKKLVEFFKELSNGEGDLTKTMKVNTKDEVGEVIIEFNKFISKLRYIINEVKDSSNIITKETIAMSNNVSSCTDVMLEISKRVSKVSDNMMDNSAAIEETTSATHEMNKVSDVVATSCMQVSEQSNYASEITEDGSKAIQDIIYSINDISVSSEEVIIKMNELQSLSNKINEIVEIITGVSKQTNLLSLNASIEAAKAGEQGKGFAVVAGEIRKLAEESNKSSLEIVGLIKEVQGNIKDTAQKVEAVSENIASGVDKANFADRKFKEISKAINIVSEKSHDIAAAAQEQVASVEQVSNAMEEIAKVTASTADDSYKMNLAMQNERESMEEVNQVTQKLTKIIKELNTMVEKFKTS